MNEDDYRKKKLIKDILDNPLFEPIIEEIRVEIGLMMLEARDEAKRIELYSLNMALNKLVGHLTAIANEVKVENG